MRIPEAALHASLAEAYDTPPALPPVGQIVQLAPAAAVHFGGRRAVTPTTAFLAESVFARKLGAADLLVEGHLFGTVSPAALAVDVVPDPATGLSELTHMLSLHVQVDGGMDLLPTRTPSYSRFVWVRRDQLRAALAANNVLHLVPDLDIMVCMYGLCIRSAAEIADSTGAGVHEEVQ